MKTKSLISLLASRTKNWGEESGCWEWQGLKNKASYGKIFFLGFYVGAHKISYELHNGPVPDGMFVCHTCDNPFCIRPSHLYVGDAKKNAEDMVLRDRISKSLPLEIKKEIIENKGNLTNRQLSDKYKTSLQNIMSLMMGRAKVVQLLGLTPNYIPEPKPEKKPRVYRFKNLSLDERIQEKIRKEGECWIWMSKIKGKHKFISYKGEYINVSRYLFTKKWSLEKGVWLYRCQKNEDCVNPDHHKRYI